ESQMKEDRNQQQLAMAGGPAGAQAEGSAAGDMATAGIGGSDTTETGTFGAAGSGGGGDDAVTKSDKQAVTKLRLMEQQEAKKQRRADLLNSLKPRNIGSTMWNRAKSGLGAMKARGVRGNLRKAASTAAKVAGVTTV